MFGSENQSNYKKFPDLFPACVVPRVMTRISLENDFDMEGNPSGDTCIGQAFEGIIFPTYFDQSDSIYHSDSLLPIYLIYFNQDDKRHSPDVEQEKYH